MNVNIKTFKTNFAVVLCGGENWSLTFSEERTIRKFENGVLRGIFGFKRGGVKRSGENYIMRSLMFYTEDIIFWVLKLRKDNRGM